jgi:hypothetical protein
VSEQSPQSPFVVNQPDKPQPADPREEPVIENGADPVVLCSASYDEPRRAERAGASHSCSLEEDHDGLHHCSDCGHYWLARVGVTEVSATAREQVDHARRDARLNGTGFVAITRVKDVRAQGGWGLAYDRVAPERVMVRAEKDRKNGNGNGNDNGNDETKVKDG